MNENELDERKTKILNAIIRNYLETGEPVGSRTISKYTGLLYTSLKVYFARLFRFQRTGTVLQNILSNQITS